MRGFGRGAVANAGLAVPDAMADGQAGARHRTLPDRGPSGTADGIVAQSAAATRNEKDPCARRIEARPRRGAH
jgi:hypothetical protein